jgi:uncharacterized protein (TIGR03083 family)
VARVPRHQVLRLFDEGVDSFDSLARELSRVDWTRPACGTWSAAQLARHVAAVADWYHGWLDRAETGDAAPPFRPADLAPENERAVAALAGLDGPAAAERFVVRAHAYRDRLPGDWDLPFGYPRGTVTAGLHAGVAACEWHLHTWDLARSAGRGHRPSDPAALYTAAGVCLATAQAGIKGRVATALVPIGARLRPWEALLRQSGRAPQPDD